MAALGDEDVDNDDEHCEEQGGEDARDCNPHNLGRCQGGPGGLHEVDVRDGGTADRVTGRAIASAADVRVLRHTAGRRG